MSLGSIIFRQNLIIPNGKAMVGYMEKEIKHISSDVMLSVSLQYVIDIYCKI